LSSEEPSGGKPAGHTFGDEGTAGAKGAKGASALASPSPSHSPSPIEKIEKIETQPRIAARVYRIQR